MNGDVRPANRVFRAPFGQRLVSATAVIRMAETDRQHSAYFDCSPRAACCGYCQLAIGRAGL